MQEMSSFDRVDSGTFSNDRFSHASTRYSPYEIPFNPEPLRKPRRLRVVCIGAGFAGMTLAYKFLHERQLSGVIDFQIYELQHDVGGTWLANKYPGLTCDVPIHIYTLPWAPKHDWNRYMAGRDEIIEYVRSVKEKFQLDRCMSFNTSIEQAVWNGATGKWHLTFIRDGENFSDECDILIGATGTQSTPTRPSIPGVESFQGSTVHTGAWDDSVDCKGKRVAVIGNGSSGIQVFTALQKEAKHITHYIRSPTWISLNYMSQFTRNEDGRNFEYTDEEKATFKNPDKLFEYRRKLESTSNGIFKNLVFDETMPEVKKKFRTQMEYVMKERLNHDEVMIKRLMPTYQPWCRRLTPGDGYLEALQACNAELIDDAIERVTSTSILTQAGTERLYDILIFATGFNNSRLPPYKITGSNSQLLESAEEGYLSLLLPNLPNFFTLGCGPNFTIANGPVLSSLGFCADYIIQWLQKISSEDIKSITVKNERVEAYNIYLQQILRRTAWNRECQSWYKKGKKDEYRTGITAIYPGSMLHFKDMIERIRAEDFEIEYWSSNPFKFFGCGLTEKDLSEEQPDLSEYLAETMRLENML